MGGQTGVGSPSTEGAIAVTEPAFVVEKTALFITGAGSLATVAQAGYAAVIVTNPVDPAGIGFRMVQVI